MTNADHSLVCFLTAVETRLSFPAAPSKTSWAMLDRSQTTGS